MVFTSPRFLLFVAALLVVLGLIAERERKKRVLAAASCFFYAAWDWRYLGLLLVISVIDYVAARRIDASDAPRTRKAWLILSLTSNLAILGYFKYSNFFIENVNRVGEAIGLHLSPVAVLLPVGISFYTFKTMSYTIDVYRRELAPARSWIDYATFITFFPELIAGPIVRGSIFLPQLQRDIGPTRERLLLGGSIFLQGLFKKLMIADRMAGIADQVFANPGSFSPATVWCGVLAYTIQIYCDFSGYSDMAIGTARMIGYDLPENFRIPYASASIAEFWRRWHMTLSAWLRDYLYIPLGGNRHGELHAYRNLLLTMLLGGLWHGAHWNFVLWGGLHGIALAIHRWWQRTPVAPSMPSWLARVITLLFVIAMWVPFRAESFGTTMIIWQRMAGVGPAGAAVWYPEWLWWCGGIVVLAHLWAYGVETLDQPGTRSMVRRLVDAAGFKLAPLHLSGTYVVPERSTMLGAYVITLVLLLMFFFAPLQTNPFIYFQF